MTEQTEEKLPKLHNAADPRDRPEVGRILQIETISGKIRLYRVAMSREAKVVLEPLPPEEVQLLVADMVHRQRARWFADALRVTLTAVSVAAAYEVHTGIRPVLASLTRRQLHATAAQIVEDNPLPAEPAVEAQGAQP